MDDVFLPLDDLSLLPPTLILGYPKVGLFLPPIKYIKVQEIVWFYVVMNYCSVCTKVQDLKEAFHVTWIASYHLEQIQILKAVVEESNTNLSMLSNFGVWLCLEEF